MHSTPSHCVALLTGPCRRAHAHWQVLDGSEPQDQQQAPSQQQDQQPAGSGSPSPSPRPGIPAASGSSSGGGATEEAGTAIMRQEWQAVGGEVVGKGGGWGVEGEAPSPFRKMTEGQRRLQEQMLALYEKD